MNHTITPEARRVIDDDAGRIMLAFHGLMTGPAAGAFMRQGALGGSMAFDLDLAMQTAAAAADQAVKHATRRHFEPEKGRLS